MRGLKRKEGKTGLIKRGSPWLKAGSIFMVVKCDFPLVATYAGQAHRTRLDHQELRKRLCDLLPSARGLLQTESQVGSGSAEGLQGAGVGDHFLAQERVTQSVSTSLDPAVCRVLYFEGSGSACTRPHPYPRP